MKKPALFGAFVLSTMLLFADSSPGPEYQVLHRFLNLPHIPYAGLVRASDGNFYGTTRDGGAANHGTVFKMDSAGVVTVLHSFTEITAERLEDRWPDGTMPIAELLEGSDGNFYGTTIAGGENLRGTIFKMDRSGAVTTLHHFDGNDGDYPWAALIEGSDGHFYGTTEVGGTSAAGTIFKLDRSGTLSVLHTFAGSDGRWPQAGLIEGSDGSFYGTTSRGGANNGGTVFKISSSGVMTTLHSFGNASIIGIPVDARNGIRPLAGLIEASDGNFYGTTFSGGTTGRGTVFKMDSSGNVTTLHSFSGSDGTGPRAELIQASDGNFYGTTAQGGANADNRAGIGGTVFKMNSSGAVTTLHSFGGPDGNEPVGSLVEGSDATFYGVTLVGGTAGKGTLFKITASGAFTTLHSFRESDGDTPVGALVQGSDGNFYGTTFYGGAADKGTVFKMDASARVTVLHSFSGTDGDTPRAGLIEGSDGNFYGTTLLGGATNMGTVFKMDSLGAVTTLHSFTGVTGLDGNGPGSSLLEGSDGNFYGTTFYGGATDAGTVFKITPSGSVTVIHSFATIDGANPVGGLVHGNDGHFYGTTYSGGTANRGTVFKITSAGALTTLHSFAGRDDDTVDGDSPFSTLIQASDGNFYGTTLYGGASDRGTVFKMNSSGVVTVLHSFATEEGTTPHAGMLQASDGNFYGTTVYGGAGQKGTVFKMNFSGVLTVLHSFATVEAGNPSTPLIEGSDRNLYGTAINGHTYGGLIFRLNIATPSSSPTPMPSVSPSPTPAPSATASPTPTTSATPTASPSPTATPTATPNPSPSPSATPAALRMMNISSRLRVQTNDDVGIGGFIVRGDAPKKVIVRGLGPSLSVDGTPVPGRLENPMLELHDGSGLSMLANDNWKQAPNSAEMESSGLAPSDDRESAILLTLPPGNYTAIIRGVNDTAGVSLVEVYDLESTNGAQLANLSTRANVLTDDDVLIGGVIVRGGDSSRIVFRAIGPSMQVNDRPVAGRLDDPTLELHDSNGVLMTSNDNWKDASNSAEIQSSGLAPNDDRESAILATVSPGNYTAIVQGANRTTGIGLIEAYNLGNP